MNRIVLLLMICFLGFNTSHAQKNLNDYKYIIVPTKYDLFDEEDKYQLNSLTNFLFNKYGFKSVMSDEKYPSDLKDDGCKVLRANVVSEKGLFKTKIQVVLRDCSSELVFKTKMGESREKEFSKAYNLALRDAFKSFQEANYKYSDKSFKEVVSTSKIEDDSEVEALKAKIKKLESENITVKEIETPKKVESAIIKPQIQPAKIAVEEKEVKNISSKKIVNNVLYAQVIDGGYQVVDSAPKVVMILYSTGKQNTYIVKDQNAIVYQEDGFWYLSKNVNSKTETKRINIKF